MSYKTILLVEDNPYDALLTKIAFEKSKLPNPLVIIKDGAIVSDYFEGTGTFEGRDINDLPALVILDMHLPHVSGLEILRYIRNNKPTSLLPVIILTSSKEDNDRFNSYAEGANSFVQKPVLNTDFIETLKNLGLYWIVSNET